MSRECGWCAAPHAVREPCDHAALKADPTRWAALRLVGRQYTPADAYGPEETLELRDCPCGSTLAIIVPTLEIDRNAR